MPRLSAKLSVQTWRIMIKSAWWKLKWRGRPEHPYTLLYVIMRCENQKPKTIMKNKLKNVAFWKSARIGITADTGAFLMRLHNQFPVDFFWRTPPMSNAIPNRMIKPVIKNTIGIGWIHAYSRQFLKVPSPPVRKPSMYEYTGRQRNSKTKKQQPNMIVLKPHRIFCSSVPLIMYSKTPLWIYLYNDRTQKKGQSFSKFFRRCIQ